MSAFRNINTMGSPSKIKQWITHQDGLEKLQLTEGSISEPAHDEVLIKIHAVSLNYRDTEGTLSFLLRHIPDFTDISQVCMGLYGHHASITQSKALVPCSDMCGTIVSVGSTAASTWKPGQRVVSIFNQTHQSGQITEADMTSGLGLPLPGVLAEYRIFPSYGIVAVPAYLTDEEAACLPIAAVTAWMSLNWQQPMGKPISDPEMTVLLQGTGGVSIAGLQIATALGLKSKSSFPDSLLCHTPLFLLVSGIYLYHLLHWNTSSTTP